MKYKKNKPYNNNRLYGGMIGGGAENNECFRRLPAPNGAVQVVLQDEAGAESENIIVKLHDSDEKEIKQPSSLISSPHSRVQSVQNDASDTGKISRCFEFQAISKTIGPKSIARVSTPTRRAVSSDSDGSVTDEDNLEAKKMVAKNIQREEDEEGAQGFKQNVKYTLSSNAQAVSPDSAFRVFKDNLKAKKTVENKRKREEMKLKFVEANKKRKDEIDKKQIDKLKQDIETEYKECKKKLDEIDVQKQVFVSTKQESENPEKIEINIKRKALYDKIEENSNELEKLYQETLSISSAGERYELQEKRTQYDKGKEKEKRVELRKEKILEQITTREDKERDDRDAEIRKLKNEILVLQKNKSINESKLSVLNNNLLATERLNVKDQDGWVNKDDDEEIRRLTEEMKRARNNKVALKYKDLIFDRITQISKSIQTMEALHKKKIETQTASIEILKETIDRESGEEERAEITLQRLEEQNKELIAKLESKIDKEDKKGGAVERPPPQNQSPPSEYIVVGDPKHTVKKLQDIKRKMKELCLEINNKFITIKSEDSRFYELLKREEEVTKEEKEKLMIEQHEEEEKLKMLKENVDKETKEDIDLIDANKKVEMEAEMEQNAKEEEEERKLKEKDEEEERRKKEEDDKEKQIELLKLKTEKQNKSYGNINRLLAQLIGALKEQYIDETESETESESEEDA